MIEPFSLTSFHEFRYLETAEVEIPKASAISAFVWPEFAIALILLTRASDNCVVLLGVARSLTVFGSAYRKISLRVVSEIAPD